MTEKKAPRIPRESLSAFAIALVIAVGLTYVFWADLWHGGGLIGGDIYTYYFPQKTFFADRIRDGEFPLWNNLVGHGYPLIGESQTGAYYPFHLLLYPQLDVNTAYNTVQLIHYVLAFVFTWMYSRRIGLSQSASLLAGLIYTFGWFPTRIVLEWAIIGGAWLPAVMWCTESYLQSRRIRYIGGLTFALTMQLVAGHYNLAFITQLLLLCYIPGRLLLAKSSGIEGVWLGSQRSAAPSETNPGAPADQSQPHRRRRDAFMLLFAMTLSYGLSAIQLVPTWELMQVSQRSRIGRAHRPAQGHLPAGYLGQIVAPWHYYDGTDEVVKQRLRDLTSEGFPRTNKIEAHLYFSLTAVGLLVFGILSGVLFRDPVCLLWIGIAVLFTVYCTGWLVPMTNPLPGFRYFEGPGRFGIVTTFSVAVLVATVWDRMARSTFGFNRFLLFAVCFGLIAADLWWVGRTVQYAAIVSNPPIRQRDKSPIRKILTNTKQPARLFSRGANSPTLLGVASTPVYLGLAPAEYFDPALAIPEPAPLGKTVTAEQIKWLRQAGVTHILSFEPLEETEWPVTGVWRGFDPLLNRALDRHKPMYLYELHRSRGRLSWAEPSAEKRAEIREYRANRVLASVSSPNGGTLILTDLDFPGWVVLVDGEPQESQRIDGMYRGVNVPPGKHTVVWAYRPRSRTIGLIITLTSLLGGSIILYRHRRRRRQSTE